MVKSSLSFIISVLAFAFVGNYSVTETQTRVHKGDDLMIMKLENVQIKAQTIGSFFSTFALSSDVPIGLEISSGEEKNASYIIDFKQGSLSEFLNQFVTQHSQYAWEIQDGVVNIFPKNEHRVALIQDLLKTKIGRFSIKKDISCGILIDSLMSTSEIKRILEVTGTKYRTPDINSFYIPQVGRNFSLDVSNATLKSILNKVVRLSPTAKFWVITKDSDGSLDISLAANHEDSHRTN